MSFSRDRYEAAQEIVSDAARAGTVPEACVDCVSTRRMAGAAIETGRGPEISGAQSVARGYLTVIAGCTGVEACKGVAFFPAEATAPPAAAQITPFPPQQ